MTPESRDSLFVALAAPLPPERITWRVGSTNAEKTRGMALAYIDARDVMERLDQVCGPGGWQCRYSHAATKTICDLGIRIGDEWIWKADGAGDTDFEAEKGALSDAFKRAAVRWGIGRYLYDVEARWVEIEARGKSYTIKESALDSLRTLLGNKPTPQHAAAPSAHRKWVDGAKAKLGTIKTMATLDEWETANEKALIKLRDMDHELWASLKSAMADTAARLTTLGAG